MFRQLDVDIDTATNNEKALAALATAAYDLVISDIARPGQTTSGLALVPADSFLDLWRVTLNPPIKRRIVDIHPALGHHLLKVPVADAIPAVPADAEQDDLGRKPAALEHRHRGETLQKPVY